MLKKKKKKKNPAYLTEINEEIKHVAEEYAVLLCNRKEMRNVPISDNYSIYNIRPTVP